MRRWLRCLVCLLLICALLINLSPIRAEATTAGAIGIAKASVVTGNPYLIAGAALVTLGVYAASESGAFENLVDNAVSYLDSAGSWIADGSMQLLQTVTEAGQTAYYVAGDLLENLRNWLFSENVIVATSVEAFSSGYTATDHFGTGVVFESDAPFYVGYIYETYTYGFNNVREFVIPTTSNVTMRYSSGNIIWILEAASGAREWMSANSQESSKSWTIPFYGTFNTSADFKAFLNSFGSVSITTTQDLTLGNVSSVPIDGTSARTWAPDVADRNGLYVKYNNDPEPPDDNNGKWFWRLALPLTIAELIAMSQADEWTGETPEEFPTGDTVTEFEILDRPEIDGYQGIEISPVTDPSPGTGGDSGEDPDTGGDTDPTAPGEPNPDPDPDPDPEGGLDPDPDPGTDPDAGGDTGSDTGGDLVDVKPVNFFLDLRNYFPFCIPFDIAAFIGALVAPAEAPVFHWELQDLSGNVYPIDVDLSPWDAHAQLFRDVQLVLFIIGLALITRNMIKW